MFSKNQQVTLFQTWNEQTGSYTFQQATVYSCGKKQMVLNARDDANDCLGRNFLPTEKQYCSAFVLPAVSDAEAMAIAVRLSAEYQAAEVARYDNLLQRYAERHGSGEDAYTRSITRDRDIIAAAMPAAMPYETASAVGRENYRPGQRLPRYA